MIEHLIGAGAMGRVYRAWHVGLERVCAVKVIRESAPLTDRAQAPSGALSRSETLRSPGASSGPAPDWRSTIRSVGALRSGAVLSGEAVARFQVEARAVSRLDHPNILRLIDFGCEELARGSQGAAAAGGASLWYLVTEHLDGADLSDLLNAEPILPTARIVAIMRQLCAGLQHAHDAGVVHRDIKPENIRLVPRVGDDGAPFEQVKLFDFGTAKLLRDDPPWTPTNGSALPVIPVIDEDGGRLVIGTPAYMSPEQAAGQGVDGRSDIYACGVLLYEMATGRLPFDRPTPISLATAHIESSPPPPSAFYAGIDPHLEALILQCLRKNPDDRPESARALRAALGRLVPPTRERFAPTARPPTPHPTDRAEAAHALHASTWVGHRPSTPLASPSLDLAIAVPEVAVIPRSASSASTWVGHRTSPCPPAELVAGPSAFPPAQLEPMAPAARPSARLFIPVARPRRRVRQRSEVRRRARRLRSASPVMLATMAAAVLGVSMCVGMGVAGGRLDVGNAPHGGRVSSALPTGDGGSLRVPAPEPPIRVKQP